MEDGTLRLKANMVDPEDEVIHLPVGVNLNVVIAIPFLDVNPLAATE